MTKRTPGISKGTEPSLGNLDARYSELNPDRRSLRRMIAGIGVAVAGVLLWVVVEPVSFLFFNSTPSLPTGLYIVRDVPTQVGDVVAVCLGEEASALSLSRGYVGVGDCRFGTAPAGKAWAAGSGDTVRVTVTGVWIGSYRLPRSVPLETDRHGYRLPVAHGEHVLGPEEVWLYSGFDARSFDSRYFGPVHFSQIRGKVTPVWIRREMYDPRLDLPPHDNRSKMTALSKGQ